MTAGVDEVGRGPLAGPVVAAAVIIEKPIPGVKDSKKLTAKQRASLAQIIQQEAIAYAYGRAEVEEIDSLNIHHATLLAMQRAIQALPLCPHIILIDGLFAPNVSIPCQTIVKGDGLIYQISAASIIAKVWRDTEMERMDELYPGYGFAQHKGYGTAQHRHALEKLGLCPIHRKSFNRR